MYTVMILQIQNVTETSNATSVTLNTYEEAKTLQDMLLNTAHTACNTYVSIEDQHSILSIKTLQKTQK